MAALGHNEPSRGTQNRQQLPYKLPKVNRLEGATLRHSPDMPPGPQNVSKFP
jgi:hypothetical protein